MTKPNNDKKHHDDRQASNFVLVIKVIMVLFLLTCVYTIIVAAVKSLMAWLFFSKEMMMGGFQWFSSVTKALGNSLNDIDIEKDPVIQYKEMWNDFIDKYAPKATYQIAIQTDQEYEDAALESPVTPASPVSEFDRITNPFKKGKRIFSATGLQVTSDNISTRVAHYTGAPQFGVHYQNSETTSDQENLPKERQESLEEDMAGQKEPQTSGAAPFYAEEADFEQKNLGKWSNFDLTTDNGSNDSLDLDEHTQDDVEEEP